MQSPTATDRRPHPGIPLSALLIFLAIELIDELVFGVREAAWPMIRTDLGINYLKVGVLLSVPALLSNTIEPFLGILSDYWRRWAIIIGGGLVFAIALGAISLSHSFEILLVALILLYPASGAFVGLSQAALMDADPLRREQNMARWTFAGSIGVVVGPLMLNFAVSQKMDWRGVFGILAGVTVLLAATTWRMQNRIHSGRSRTSIQENSLSRINFANVRRAIMNRSAWRWLVLLQFSDLMLDVLLGFLALYFVDVAGGSISDAAFAVSIWAFMGLLGDFLLIPLLEKVNGLTYLRISTILELFLFPLFLLVHGLPGKLVFLGLLGFFNAGWYAILKARLYRELPGQSGTALALDNVAGVFGSLLPLGLGWTAQTYGLKTAMWVLLLGPLVMATGLYGRSMVGSREV